MWLSGACGALVVLAEVSNWLLSETNLIFIGATCADVIDTGCAVVGGFWLIIGVCVVANGAFRTDGWSK